MTKRFVLTGRCPNGAEVTFRLSSDRLIVGRRGDMRIPDDSVSRHHASLERRADGWLLSDLGSRNGTTVNGISVVRQLLSPGDTVGFGKVRLKVETDTTEAAPSPASDFLSASSSADDPVTGIVEGATMTWGTAHIADRGAIGVLRHLSDGSYATPKDAFNRMAEDVSGIRGVAAVRIAVDGRTLGGCEDVICEAGSFTRYAKDVVNQLVSEVRAKGECKSLVNGSIAEFAIGADIAAFPLHLRGTTVTGAVVVEAKSRFDDDCAADLNAEISGLEIAIGIWSGIVGVGRGLKARPAKSGATPVMVGRSEALQEAVRMATRAAKSDATILLFGESGTGKELFARLIYDESARREKPFLAVHSSAIEQTLLGSALFGHEKGAFTGADRQKKGLFEEADGGTIFLDEIGELSPDMQVKLLRVLQEGEFMRVGGTETIHVNVRVICATNRDLAAAVKEGKFREDLYYRLNVIKIDLPPLRERRGDVENLVNHFVSTLGGRGRRVSGEAMSALVAYRWPGNIRELRNCIERTLVLSTNEELQLKDFPKEIREAADATEVPRSCATATHLSTSTLADMEAAHIREVLDSCGGNKKLAAERLGISRSTLYEKLASCPPSGHTERGLCPTSGHTAEKNGDNAIGTEFASKQLEK